MKKFLLIGVFLLGSLFSQDVIRVGYDGSSMDALSKKDVAIASDVWLKEIAREINYETQSTVYDDSAQMAQDLVDGKLDYISAFGLVFVEHFDLSKLEDGFAAGFFNGEKETFVILVQKESGIKSLADLRDKRIAIQKNDAVAKLYIKNGLHAKEAAESFTEEALPTRQRALLKPFFGQVNAAVVTNKSYELAKELNPQIGQKLRVLEVTDLEATNFGFLRKNLDEKTKNVLRDIAKNIHKTERGKTLLTLYKTEVLSDSKLKDLQPFKELYEKTLQLKKEEK
jgi:ABC-type phosphate/phosphonate transport system substrate-binding protein